MGRKKEGGGLARTKKTGERKKEKMTEKKENIKSQSLIFYPKMAKC